MTTGEVLVGSYTFEEYITYPPDEDPDPLQLNNDADHIISAVVNGDLVELKKRLTSPVRIQDKDGYYLLHIAIYVETSKEVFDYLIDLGYDCNEEEDCQRETPLLLALSRFSNNDIPIKGDYFAAKLIEKGANVDVYSIYEPDSTALYFALDRHFPATTKLLLLKYPEMGLNRKGDPSRNGKLKLQAILNSNFNNKLEFVATVVIVQGYFTISADEWILALKQTDVEVANFLEPFLSDDDKNSKISIDNMLYFMRQVDAEQFEKIMSKFSGVALEEIDHFLNPNPLDLISANTGNLRFVISKYRSVFQYIAKKLQGIHLRELNSTTLENLAVILDNPEWSCDIIHKIQIPSPKGFLDQYKADPDIVMQNLYLLLSYGFTLNYYVLEQIFKEYGFNDLFSKLLFFEISPPEKPSRHRAPDMPLNFICFSLYFVSLDMYDFFYRILNKYRFYFDLDSVFDFLSYSSLPILMDYCHGWLNEDPSDIPVEDDERVFDLYEETIIKNSENKNAMPLKEICRDATRRAIVLIYDAKTPAMFYTVLKKLPLPKSLQKIVSYESKMYFFGNDGKLS